MLLTNTRYTQLTGAPAPANFTALQQVVIGRLEGMLNRLLTSEERTERATPTFDGIYYPKATPVTAVQDDLDFDDIAVRTGRHIDLITYTGGYTEETLPAPLAAALAWGIHTLANSNGGTGASPIPPGISSLNIAGEYSVTFAGGHTPGADGFPLPERWVHMADLGGRCVTGALRYRRIPL